MSIRKSEFSLLQRLNTFASLTFMRKIKTGGATKSQSRLETSQIFELPLLFSLEWWVKERKKGDVGGVIHMKEKLRVSQVYIFLFIWSYGQIVLTSPEPYLKLSHKATNKAEHFV